VVLKAKMIEIKIIAALLRDVSNAHGLVFNTRSVRLTLAKVHGRLSTEGLSFLTVTMPRLAKAFDKAIAGGTPLNSVKWGFKSLPNSELPIFMGEFFQQVLAKDGALLPNPCPKSVRVIREFLYLWYKYELPYTDEKEQKVVQAFIKTEDDIRTFTPLLDSIRRWFDETRTELSAYHGVTSPSTCAWGRLSGSTRLGCFDVPDSQCEQPLNSGFASHTVGEGINAGSSDPLDDTPQMRTLRNAPGDKARGRPIVSPCDASHISFVRRIRQLLDSVFSVFDPLDIYPRHGPGVVATKQRLGAKYQWTNVSAGITDLYPFDAYFCASSGHVCDSYSGFGQIGTESLPARVILVPKDSRGPRLISCEPVDYQWVQQGLGRAIVRAVEEHELTKFNVHFTDQGPNQRGALLGSSSGRYATLDLKEASDRVSLALVRLLFPSKLVSYLEACRSSSTELPDGSILNLQKFAPMGSCLCFPILALTVWAILAAGAPDQDTCDGILVYGDDVIVPTAYAGNAIEHLESFGLLVNRDKSCTSGLFRESCGTDAFQGVNVTPVRIRTVWSYHPSADVYASWIAYANSFYDRQYFHTYDTIVAELYAIYGPIPTKEHFKALSPDGPYLREIPEYHRPVKRRWNKRFQKHEFLVNVAWSPIVMQPMSGWDMLLRYFAEKGNPCNLTTADSIGKWTFSGIDQVQSSMSVRSYTRRSTSILVKRWR